MDRQTEREEPDRVRREYKGRGRGKICGGPARSSLSWKWPGGLGTFQCASLCVEFLPAHLSRSLSKITLALRRLKRPESVTSWERAPRAAAATEAAAEDASFSAVRTESPRESISSQAY